MSSRKNIYQRRTGPRAIAGRPFPFARPSKPGRIVAIRRTKSGRVVS